MPKRDSGPSTPNPAPNLTEELRRLEAIVRQLESEDTDLDQALTLFADGVERLRVARSRLKEAEATVQRVLEDADGNLTTTDLDA